MSLPNYTGPHFSARRSPESREVEILAGRRKLGGFLAVPQDAKGIVIFAHGSGSSRHSTRNRQVADFLNENQFATLLADMLTAEEGIVDEHTREFRFDISLLAKRLGDITGWVKDDHSTAGLPIGYFGASTGAAAALIAAARHPEIRAVVSRGGRVDLAADFLPLVHAPVRLIVGARDEDVLALNRSALEKMRCPADLSVVQGATHLFEEPGALEQVSRLASEWFQAHLGEGHATAV